MVGCGLDGEVERDLEPVLVRGGDHAVEIRERAELGVDRVVPAFLAAGSVGAARILGPGGQRIVRPLAVLAPDRMDRREIKRVETHVADRAGGDRSRRRRCRAADVRRARVSGPSNGETAHTTRRSSPRSVRHRPDSTLIEARAGRSSAASIAARRSGDSRIVTLSSWLASSSAARCCLSGGRKLALCPRRRLLNERASLHQIHRLRHFRVDLLGEIALEAAETVEPALDHEFVPPQPLERELGAPAVVGELIHALGIPALRISRPPAQLGRQLLMSVGEYGGFDAHPVAHHALDHEGALVDAGGDVLHH